MGNPKVTNNFSMILHWSYFHSWLLVIGITSVKLSVGFFLLRLVQGKWYKVSSSDLMLKSRTD
jgi:presenilin-like A22 family membrane protease